MWLIHLQIASSPISRVYVGEAQGTEIGSSPCGTDELILVRDGIQFTYPGAANTKIEPWERPSATIF